MKFLAFIKSHLNEVLYVLYVPSFVQYLVEKQHADIESTDVNGFAPLVISLLYTIIDIAKDLIEKGADIKEHDNDGKAPIHWMSLFWSLPALKFLIENGVDVNTENNNKDTPLIIACINLNDTNFEVVHSILEYLLSKGADISHTDISGCTPLYVVRYNQCELGVKFLIENGVDETQDIPFEPLEIRETP